MSCNVIKVTKLESKIVTLEVPKIDVKHYPIYAIDDSEEDGHLFARAAEYGEELIRRHDRGETYAIGYRMWKNGKIHLVLRRVVNGKLMQRIVGVDDDFVELEEEVDGEE